MIRSLLVANRGEIARRIIRTCQELGIRSVAVHSEADADLPFVDEADVAVCIGPPDAASSYLNIANILDAARRTGADAVHPGYGFLAENADFAREVTEAGLIWVGPPPEAIEAMGDKAAARVLADEHGVPIVPGFDASQDPDALLEAAQRIGAPVLIKATAGGGGRGMRRVDDLDTFASALDSARREAQSAFGSDTVIVERYITTPRHVEVQVFADAHGHTIHLGERECSIQRRHQKVLEEAPSPAVDDALRARMGEAAIRVAEAAKYVGAGTVEFILAPDGEFYFLEMNTRLQVEHPVTELVTGLDLVALQIRVAEGQPLPLSQDDVVLNGWSIEARVTCEDPMRDWLPATGTLHRVDLAGPGVRVDSGLEDGGTVSPWYDSMVAKVIVHGATRAEATRKLARAIDRAWMPGVVNNLPLLRQVLAHPAWASGDLHTHFLEHHGLPQAPPLNPEVGIVAGCALAWWLQRARSPVPHLPMGWRLHGNAPQTEQWQVGADTFDSATQQSETGLMVQLGETVHTVQVHDWDGRALTLTLDGIRARWRVVVVRGGSALDRLHGLEDGDQLYVHSGAVESFVQLVPRFPAVAGAEADPGSAVAPTPGTVTAVHVAVGDVVAQGQKLVTLEAMKMEHAVVAGEAGTVASVRVEAGDTVDEGALLVVLSGEDDDS